VEDRLQITAFVAINSVSYGGT